MGANSSIEWTDHTFNPWIGCAKVSPGCKHCYAEVDTPARVSRGQGVELWGPNASRRVTSDANWRKPLTWDREAKAAGERRRVFCASQSDVFEGREDLVEPRERLWELIDETPNLDWLLLTKRPENLRHMVPWCRDHAGEWRELFWHNVWIGVSVEDQSRAEARIPVLLEIPAAVRFLSVEPLLGPLFLSMLHSGMLDDSWIDCLSGLHASQSGVTGDNPRIDWVIVGGESGKDARPCRLEWFMSIAAQCQRAGVACFVKQLGANHWSESPECGFARVPLEDSKGGDPSEWPKLLQVREFPTPRENHS